MTDFAYRAATTAGKLVDGHVDAASREAALRQLLGQGLTPIRLDECDGGGRPDITNDGAGTAPLPAHTALAGAFASFVAARGPTHGDVHELTAELAIMLRAGLPLDRALRLLIGMCAKPALNALLDDVFSAVKAGKGLSQALGPHRALFGEFYISMVRSGEAGGQLAEVLTGLADYLKHLQALRESVVSALIYPSILLVVGVASMFLMLGFVVPQFEVLFEDMGEALPLPTRLVVSLGDVVASWGWLIVIGFAAGVWLLRRWLASADGRRWRDARLLALPVFGVLVRKYEITRFARSLGTLLGNGVAIVDAIRIATATMGRQPLRAAMTGVELSIRQGGRLADALERAALFTPFGLNMVRLGEEIGRLDAMLLELAGVHDAEVQSGVKRMLALVEPVLILVLGTLIGAMVVAILIGIMSVSDLAI